METYPTSFTEKLLAVLPSENFIWVLLYSCCLTVQSHLMAPCSCTQSLRRQLGLHVLKLKRPNLV